MMYVHPSETYIQCPTGVNIDRLENGQLGVIATTNISKGQIVFSGIKTVSKSPEDLDEPTAYLITSSDEVAYVIPSVHWVYKGNDLYDVYGFDSFMNHSCDANTTCVYNDDLSYTHIACHDINAGDEITVDYRTVYPPESLPDFSCACGSTCCDYQGMYRVE